MTELLSINIGINPNIVHLGGLLITWHGFFTAVGIVAGVWLAVGVASSDRVRIDPDTAYTVGMIVVAAGIIGARVLYVAENYGASGIDNFGDVFKLNEGGISIYGAIIGGAIAGWAYGSWKKLPAALGADAAVFGMLIGLAIGRIGDVINGEHLSKVSNLPWAVIYTNPNSPGFEYYLSKGTGASPAAVHPAVVYEMIGDLVILGLITWLWRRRPKPGVIFCTAFLLYAIMRFFVSFLRVDSKVIVAGLTTPQVVSLIVIAVTAPLLLYFSRRPEPDEAYTGTERGQRTITRAERRRRLRTDH